jgi:ABC-type Fe3+-hydroxamate transport system substrate-binding protein
MTVGGDTFINAMLEAAGFENIFKQIKGTPLLKYQGLRN